MPLFQKTVPSMPEKRYSSICFVLPNCIVKASQDFPLRR
jgi:hypothetical protein